MLAKMKAQINAMDPKRKEIALVVWNTMNGYLNGITSGLLINQAMGGYPKYENKPWILYPALAAAITAGTINGISFGAQELKKLLKLRAFSDAVNNGTATWLYLAIALGTLYTLLCEKLGGYIDITSNTTELLTLSESGVLQCYTKNSLPYIATFLLAGPFGIAEFCRTLATNTLDDLEDEPARTRFQKFVKKHQLKIERSAWFHESLLNSTTFAMIGAPVDWDYDTRWIQFSILLTAIGLGVGSVAIKKYNNRKYEDPANQVITFLGAVASVITFYLIVQPLGEDTQFRMIAWISMLASMLATVVGMGVYSGCVNKQGSQRLFDIQDNDPENRKPTQYEPLAISYDTDSEDDNSPNSKMKFSDFDISKEKAQQIINAHSEEVSEMLTKKDKTISSIYQYLLGESESDENVVKALSYLQKRFPAEFRRENGVSQEMRTIGINPGSNRYGTFGQSNVSGRMEDPNLSEPSNYRSCAIL